MSRNRRIHLSVDLDGAGWHPAAALTSSTGSADPLTAGYWVWAVTEAERGLLDFVTIGDSHRLASAGSDGVGSPAGRLDALMIATRVAPLTRHVGLVPTVETTITEPFLVSSQLATLDHVTGGRAGWEVRVALDEAAGGYVGPRLVPAPQERVAEAAEYVQAVRALWDSWEDDAEIRDADTHRFVDRSRLHHVDFEGRYLAVKGPSITPRPPQGQPVVATSAGGADSVGFAAASTDVLFIAAGNEAQFQGRQRAVTEAAISEGRDPDGLRLLADVAVFLDDDPSAAQEREARLDHCAGGAPMWGGLRFTGTPGDLADQLMAWSELGCDGFRLHPATVSHDLAQITRRLTAELQMRGVFRDRYEAATLRGLLGLPRPANRYAIA